MNFGNAESHHAHGSLHYPAMMLRVAYRALAVSDVTGSTVCHLLRRLAVPKIRGSVRCSRARKSPGMDRDDEFAHQQR